MQPLAHPAVDGIFFLDRPGPRAAEQLDALINRLDRIDVKRTVFNRVHHICSQNHVLHIRGRDQHALLAGQAVGFADIKKALNLFVGAANGLDLFPTD